MTDEVPEDQRIYIGQLALLIDRRRGTIRGWERYGRLPEHLRAVRTGENGWRYWTLAQVAGIREWMISERMAPGSGLFNVTLEKEQEMLAKLRGRAA